METDTPPSAGFYNLLGWFETNKKLLVKVAAVAAIAGTVTGFLVWRGGQRQIEAEEAVAAVPMPFSPSELPAPGTADAFAKIAKDYAGSPAAAKALLRAGIVYFGDGNFSKAKEQFETFIRDHPDSPWISQAVFGIAACLDGQGNAAEAIRKYDDFVNKRGGDAMVETARFSLVRLYEQTQKPELAVEVLTKYIAAQPAGNPAQGYNPATAEAQQKLMELYKKHPNLVPAPVVTPGATIQATPGVPRLLQPLPPANPPATPAPATPATPTPAAPAAPATPAAPAK